MTSEIVEAIKELGRALLERDQTNMDLVKGILENQNREHQGETLMLTNELKKIRNEMEKSRQRPVQQLPIFNGENMDIYNWENSVEEVIKCNQWDFESLMNFLPLSLQGRAKEAFSHLSPESKENKQRVFLGMRMKIAPEAVERNMKLFYEAKRNPEESMTAFIDRCKTYIKKAKGDITDNFVLGLLEMKLKSNMEQMDQKILSLNINDKGDLEAAVATADILINCGDSDGSSGEVNGKVLEFQEIKGESKVEQIDTLQTSIKGSKKRTMGPCGACHGDGHTKKNCVGKPVKHKDSQTVGDND